MPIILITNDDGIQAPGIQQLAKMASHHGEVVVVAPDGPRSAQSSALTINYPVSVKVVKHEDNITFWSCTGTPADCVKLAMSQLLDRTPDLVISGINHGSNASVNVLYSGTMGAAIEGAMHDVPSVGLSINDHSFDVSFQYCLPYFEKIIERVLEKGLPKDICLNVNAPVGEVKGLRVCRQASGRWANDFTPDNAPRPVKYYWMVGDFFNTEKDDPDADQVAMNDGYISIVPVQVDMTAYSAMDFCRNNLLGGSVNDVETILK
ncbi:MAG: 5'/3'-nucleotidase SurE [bacterium]|nr:5'/3'-nucleotidase SurE [Candidatus Minthenecus merdequi]